MKRNITTHFHHISRPNPLISLIDKETERLQGRHPRIRGFSIIVDKMGRKHKKSNQIRAQVIVTLPGKRIVISKEADGMTESDNASVALTHAFEAAERSVDQHLKKSRYTGAGLTPEDAPYNGWSDYRWFGEVPH